MNRAALRWSGIGLVICALAALIADLAISQHTLSTKPFDGTFTGIAGSLGIWAFAALGLSTHLRVRARLPDGNTRLHIKIHTLILDNAPLPIPLMFAAAQTAFLILITALTIETGLLGMAPADQKQLAAGLFLAQAMINFLALIFGSLWLNFRHGQSLTD
jgi:hypothetical protein